MPIRRPPGVLEEKPDLMPVSCHWVRGDHSRSELFKAHTTFEALFSREIRSTGASACAGMSGRSRCIATASKIGRSFCRLLPISFNVAPGFQKISTGLLPWKPLN